jgi:ribosomal protein L22
MSDLTQNPEISTSSALPPAALMGMPEESAAPSSAKAQARDLKTLARHARQAEERIRGMGMAAWKDDLSHLTPERRANWRRSRNKLAAAMHSLNPMVPADRPIRRLRSL